MKKERNLIIVKSKTRLEKLTENFNTVGQAMFQIEQQRSNFFEAASNMKFKKSRSKVASSLGSGNIDDYQKEDKKYKTSLDTLQREMSKSLKTKVIDRSFLHSFIFSPNDIVVVIGQDGLVANTAKYVTDIPIIGVNPEPERFDGVLLPFNLANYEKVVEKVLEGNYQAKKVTMAEAKMNDGQRLLAFNDLFIGPNTHTSARYQITHSGYTENHSSSGLIVSTGAGSTGWLSSLFNMAKGVSNLSNQAPNLANPQNDFNLPWDTEKLVYIVREPFVSRTSQAQVISGYIQPNDELVLESLMSENGLIFSDGIQTDFMNFNSGSIATIGIAKEKAELVIG
ncbi:MAG: NAD kinase [Arenicella sp.]